MGILITDMVGLALLSAVSAFIPAILSYPAPQDLYGKQPDGYFQYANVPAHKEYEFGWNRGHPNHYISRYEQNQDQRFRTRVRWGDSYDGYGEHYWEYNHGPSYEEPAAYVEPAKPYSPPAYVN